MISNIIDSPIIDSPRNGESLVPLISNTTDPAIQKAILQPMLTAVAASALYVAGAEICRAIRIGSSTHTPIDTLICIVAPACFGLFSGYVTDRYISLSFPSYSWRKRAICALSLSFGPVAAMYGTSLAVTALSSDHIKAEEERSLVGIIAFLANATGLSIPSGLLTAKKCDFDKNYENTSSGDSDSESNSDRHEVALSSCSKRTSAPDIEYL
jgi:hypothetical protein